MEDDADGGETRAAWMRMAWAAVRVCVFIHNDDAQGIGAMLEDLRQTSPAHWPMLAKGFEEQLVKYQSTGSRVNGPEGCLSWPSSLPDHSR